MPLKTCCVKFCEITSSDQIDGLTFHPFPQCPELKAKWLDGCCRDDLPVDWKPNRRSVVCSRHFTEKCFIQVKNHRQLKYDSVPTLGLPEKILWEKSLRDRVIAEHRLVLKDRLDVRNLYEAEKDKKKKRNVKKLRERKKRLKDEKLKRAKTKPKVVKKIRMRRKY